MTITLTAVDHEDLCHGWSWAITDEAALAASVARVALGQAKHVIRVLDGLAEKPITTTTDHVADALAKLAPDADGSFHKCDGWLHQTISWIAAQQNRNDAILRLPHIRKADHGFDGLQIELSTDKAKVTTVVIFEDKATTNPRDTIREDVWPGIVALEAGQRVTELTQDVTAILEAQQHIMPVDVEDVVDDILWKEARAYRVSITVGNSHLKEAARARLFDGYSEAAPGPKEKRRAETIYFSDMRAWMREFSKLVERKISEHANHV